MHQFKELIADINIEYKEMPEKLECLIVDKNLYINTKLSSNTDFRKSYSILKNLNQNISYLVPLMKIQKAIEIYNCNTLQKLSNFFELPTYQILQTIYFYNYKYPNLAFLKILLNDN